MPGTGTEIPEKGCHAKCESYETGDTLGEVRMGQFYLKQVWIPVHINPN